MISKQLDKALEKLKQAREKTTLAGKEYDCARKEWQPLAQARKKVNAIKSKYDKAIEEWSKLDNQFDNEHPQLVNAIKSARNALYEAENHVEEIISKLTGANNE